MSMPIMGCWISRAAAGDEDAYSQLIEAMKINLAWGAWTELPCMCRPRCAEPSQEQLSALNKRMQEYFEKNPVKENRYTSSSFDETKPSE